MSESRSNIVLVGGPRSGKTTFLGVLWSVVRTARNEADVRLDGPLPPNTGYLDAAEHAVSAGEEVERTKKGTGERIELDLAIHGDTVRLEHIDLAGETLATALEARRIPEDLAAELRQADCLLLFVHPKRVKRPAFIKDANLLLTASTAIRAATTNEANPAEDSSPPTETGEADPIEVWKKAPTSVHLVDTIQSALHGAHRDKRLNIAVIVSAWDIIEKLPPSPSPRPSAWVREHLSLLHQFLESNPDRLRWAAFGVSAQGGDYEDAETLARLVGLPCAERAVVNVDDGISADGIAEPLAWFVKG